MTDPNTVQAPNRGGGWNIHLPLNLRSALTEKDYATVAYPCTGFRTYRHFRQSLDQQQPRS